MRAITNKNGTTNKVLQELLQSNANSFVVASVLAAQLYTLEDKVGVLAEACELMQQHVKNSGFAEAINPQMLMGKAEANYAAKKE